MNNVEPAEKKTDEAPKQRPLTDTANKTVGGSWSMLKNAAKATLASTPNLLSDAVVSDKSKPADSFLKYKMQLFEKEKQLREQESLKAQREKDQLK